MLNFRLAFFHSSHTIIGVNGGDSIGKFKKIFQESDGNAPILVAEHWIPNMERIPYTASQLQATMEAMKVVARFIAEDPNCKVEYNNQGVAMANMEKKTIFIPRIGEMNYEELMKLRRWTYHEAGHIIETQLTKKDEAALSDGKNLNKVLHGLWNAVEDVRMELALYKRQPGIPEVFEWGMDYNNKKNGALFTEGFTDKRGKLWEAECAMMFTARNRVPSWTMGPEAQWYFDTGMPIFKKVKNAKNASDSLKIAKEIYELLKTRLKEEQEKKKEEKEKDKEGDDGEEQKIPLPDNDNEFPGDLDEEDVEEVLKKAIEGGKDFNEQLKEEIEKLAKERPFNGYTACTDNDEFLVPQIGDHDSYTRLRMKMNSSISGMCRNLEQALRSMMNSRRFTHLDHGKVDMKKLTAIGKNLSRQVFYRLQPGDKLDTAVVMCIDESGSMDNYGQVQLLVIALSETLTKIGVPFEIFGASTKYGQGNAPNLNGFTRTNPITYRIYKTFGEHWERVKERTLSIYARHHHIDGEVVQFSGMRLAGRLEKRKIVFSLSDGSPCGGQSMDSELGSNLIRVCNRLRLSGTEVYGFGIGTEAPSDYYGKENFVYLEDAEKMSETFFRNFASIITKGRYNFSVVR